MKLHLKTKTLNFELSTRAAHRSRKSKQLPEREQASPCIEKPSRRLKTAIWWCLGTVMSAVAQHYIESWLGS